MTEYKCGSTKQCQFGDMCKPSYDIGGCNHFKQKKPQTNEEWLKSLDTEQLAERLHKNDVYAFFVCRNGGKVPSVESIVEWLKQPHR